VESEALGGQAGTSSLIRNYLGFPSGLSGRNLAHRASQQALLFGAQFVYDSAVGLSRSGQDLTVALAGGSRAVARAVVLATGAKYRTLEARGIHKLLGAGVFYGAAASEAPAMAGRRVYVIGGGNSAGQAAIHFARYAARVTLVVRGTSLKDSMSSYLITEINANEIIDVRFETRVVAAHGTRPA
jgi:thioredoxin reductase (NADPH)